MTARVYSSDQKSVKTVKNLGWLLRHWKEVKEFYISHVDGRNFPNPEYRMQACLTDGRMYETDWASLEILWHWLDRPVFRGVKLNWFGEKTEAGNPSFNWKM